MFLITQLIGLFVISVYNSPGVDLPYGMEPPPEVQNQSLGPQIIFAFAIAITLFFILTRIKAETFIRLWFFVVTVLALGLSLNIFLIKINLDYYTSIAALLISLPLAYVKIFNRNILVHNLTELLIYPGIAAVFVPILNIFWMIILLILISIYDMWAVWHSEIMQKMAKYQIENLRFFTGFFVPYATLKQKQKIKNIKQKYASKGEDILEKQFKKAKIKVSLAILGGGDIIFPIITAGVILAAYNSIFPALIIIASATLALLGLFILAQKGKFYPAMPFISAGLFLGMIINWLVF